MIKFSRLFMMLLLSFALLAGFGCSSSTEPEVAEQPAPVAESDDAPVLDMGAILEDAGISIEIAPVYFAFDRYNLDEEAKELLKAKAELLMQYPEIAVKVEGHCDSRGTEEYNLALGERRAKAAYDYMIMLGVDPSQLSFVSYGKLYPAMEGNYEEAWSKNRRDEFRPTVNY